MLRKRNNLIEGAIETAKKFDAFPKLEIDYKETSPFRGTITVLVLTLIATLVIFEVRYFMDRHVEYSYKLNAEPLSKLKLNIDITVAMPCELIGADVADKTSNDIIKENHIELIDTWFEMSPNQSRNHKAIHSFYENLRKNYHALHSILWNEEDDVPRGIGEREVTPDYPKDACRIKASFEVNKVIGILHIIMGKPMSMYKQHSHIINTQLTYKANFSHRIDKLSFGDSDDLDEIIGESLNGDLKIAHSNKTAFLYFVSIVSTELSTKEKHVNQYAVTEREIEIKGSYHEGIAFRYDISPLKVVVEWEKKSWLDLVISLIGIVGGIFATSIMLNTLFQNFKDIVKKD